MTIISSVKSGGQWINGKLKFFYLSVCLFVYISKVWIQCIIYIGMKMATLTYCEFAYGVTSLFEITALADISE